MPYSIVCFCWPSFTETTVGNQFSPVSFPQTLSCYCCWLAAHERLDSEEESFVCTYGSFSSVQTMKNVPTRKKIERRRKNEPDELVIQALVLSDFILYDLCNELHVGNPLYLIQLGRLTILSQASSRRPTSVRQASDRHLK